MRARRNFATTPAVAHDGQERRKFPRAKLNLLIQYRFDTFDEFLCEYAEDISEGGMLLRVDAPRAVGSMVYLQFALKDGTRLIEGLSKVAYCGDGRMGVEFVSFDDASSDLIKTIVAKRLQGTGSGVPTPAG